MKLYLVRHGQTDFNAGKLMQGVKDIPLNEVGKAQVRELAEQIKGLKLDGYYVSPLVRARQTAEIITNGEAEFTVDDLLRERSFGELEGKQVDWSKIGDILDLRQNLSAGGIEPIKNVFARSKAFLGKLKATHKDTDRILIVAHGTLLKTMHYNIVGYDDDTDLRTFHLENGKMYEYDF